MRHARAAAVVGACLVLVGLGRRLARPRSSALAPAAGSPTAWPTPQPVAGLEPRDLVPASARFAAAPADADAAPASPLAGAAFGDLFSPGEYAGERDGYAYKFRGALGRGYYRKGEGTALASRIAELVANASDARACAGARAGAPGAAPGAAEYVVLQSFDDDVRSIQTQYKPEGNWWHVMMAFLVPAAAELMARGVCACAPLAGAGGAAAVSYTHLTLPTILLV